MIYLDHASYTQTDPAVLDEFCKIEREFSANPLSAHDMGLKARAKYDEIATDIANLLGASSDEIIFTSGATEANRTAIDNAVHCGRHKGKHIITNCLEHPSVSRPISLHKKNGCDIDMADILPTGIIDIDHLKFLLRDDTVLITVPWVDSELGVIQPLDEIAGIIKNYPNCHLHVDAAQAIGKIKNEIKFIGGIGSISISPHKFNGICGSGILITRLHKNKPSDFFTGTPSLSLAAASRKTFELALQNASARFEYVIKLRDYAADMLSKHPKIRINSPLHKNTCPYILNLSVNGMKGTETQSALNHHGIYVSVKSACSSQGTPSRPVFAVGKDKKNAMNSFRVSFSHLTKSDEADEFVGAIIKIAENT